MQFASQAIQIRANFTYGNATKARGKQAAAFSCREYQNIATARGETSRIPWAELLLRVFRADVLLCPCGGPSVVLAFITEKKVVKEILEHLGLAATGPSFTLAPTSRRFPREPLRASARG